MKDIITRMYKIYGKGYGVTNKNKANRNELTTVN